MIQQRPIKIKRENMAGQKCPKCAKLTFFIKGVEGKCNECGYK